MIEQMETHIEAFRRHVKFDARLVEKVLQQDEGLVAAKATCEARKLYNLSREVLGDAHRLRSFLRLKVSKHGILYAGIKTDHDIEDIIVAHFVRRFPGFVIVIESQKGSFIGSRQLKEVLFVATNLDDILKKLEETLPVVESLEEFEVFDERMWETFYKSQNMKERKNMRLFLRNIPKRFHDQEGLATESYIIKHSKRITDFIE